MKISISKATVSSIAQRMVPGMMQVASVARQAEKDGMSFKTPVPSNEELLAMANNIPFKDLISKMNAFTISLGAEDILIEINDEYIKKSAALAADFYGAIAAPSWELVKTAKTIKDIAEQYFEDCKELDKNAFSPKHSPKTISDLLEEAEAK